MKQTLLGEAFGQAHQLNGLCAVAKGIIALGGIGQCDGIRKAPVAQIGAAPQQLSKAPLAYKKTFW